MNHIQTIEQVFTESAFFHHRMEIAVGGGDDADIHLNRLMPAHAFEFPFLQNAQ